MNKKRDNDPTSRVQRESIIVIDFGSQYSMLIARRIRESKVYCEVVSHRTSWERVAVLNPKGVILSGGPASVYEEGAPLAPTWVYDEGLPVLGICYGMQVMAHQLGGKVKPSSRKEYGSASINISAQDARLFSGLPSELQVWMSHGDHITEPPAGFESLASSENSPVAVMGDGNRLLGIQFHPEVAHTPYGTEILKNFLYQVCGCQPLWTPSNFVNDSVLRIQEEVAGGNAICALSGGVDSAVAAALVHRAIGDQLTCIFVNNGLMRKGETTEVRETFGRHFKANFIFADATELFLGALKGVIDPEEKRKIIGSEFIDVFDKEATRIGSVDHLVQGTLYPDVIESETGENTVSAKIKSHHNVGGLPEHMNLSLVEPLRYLFKDEVREVGSALGLPDEIIFRQPFPGPGLAIRIIGEITHEKLDILREADAIVLEEIIANNLYRETWQSFAVLTDSRSVGVTGDYRTYGHVIAIRAVNSDDAMTADWARLPFDVLGRMSNRIANEVPGVNRVVYDITSKPPGTIEWE